jgi:ubiquitin-protein ligase
MILIVRIKNYLYININTNTLIIIEWFGVIFVRSGYYQHATLKFQLDLLPDYPYSAPLVTFITDTFHPLVNQNGQFSLKPKFNPWVSKQHHILDVLFYLKKSFKKSFLEELTEAECFNKEAWRMYHNELHLFSRLAQQCAKVSNADSVLYDDYPSGNPVKFKPLSDSKFEEIRTHILGPDANNNTNSLQLTTNSGSNSPSKFLDSIKNNISNNINKLFEP